MDAKAHAVEPVNNIQIQVDRNPTSENTRENKASLTGRVVTVILYIPCKTIKCIKNIFIQLKEFMITKVHTDSNYISPKKPNLDSLINFLQPFKEPGKLGGMTYDDAMKLSDADLINSPLIKFIFPTHTYLPSGSISKTQFLQTEREETLLNKEERLTKQNIHNTGIFLLQKSHCKNKNPENQERNCDRYDQLLNKLFNAWGLQVSFDTGEVKLKKGTNNAHKAWCEETSQNEELITNMLEFFMATKNIVSWDTLEIYGEYNRVDLAKSLEKIMNNYREEKGYHRIDAWSKAVKDE